MRFPDNLWIAVVGIIPTVLLVSFGLILFLSMKNCANTINEKGGMSGVISEIIIDAEEFIDNVKKKTSEKRGERNENETTEGLPQYCCLHYQPPGP